MGKPICRMGDIGSGICTGHKVPIPMVGTLLATAATVTAEGMPVGLMGDTVMGNCGHTGTMVQGDGAVTATGVGVVRVGDAFVGTFTGTMIKGASTVS